MDAVTIPTVEIRQGHALDLLERIPEDDRPAHLAWYNLVLNASVLVGTLAGPLIAGWTGLVTALIIIGGLRFLAGLAILKWG